MASSCSMVCVDIGGRCLQALAKLRFESCRRSWRWAMIPCGSRCRRIWSWSSVAMLCRWLRRGRSCGSAPLPAGGPARCRSDSKQPLSRHMPILLLCISCSVSSPAAALKRQNDILTLSVTTGVLPDIRFCGALNHRPLQSRCQQSTINPAMISSRMLPSGCSIGTKEGADKVKVNRKGRCARAFVRGFAGRGVPGRGALTAREFLVGASHRRASAVPWLRGGHSSIRSLRNRPSPAE